MQDSEQEYPLHQPRRNGHRGRADDQTQPEREGQPPSRYRQHNEGLVSQLPRNRLQNTLLIGAVAGILSALVSIGITFANSSLYSTASTTPVSKYTLSLALTLVGLQCLSFFIILLLSFVGGFITGKVAIERRLGFVAGFLAGIIYYAVAIFLIRYIPGYPGNAAISTTGSNGGAVGVAGGIVVTLVFLFVTGIIAGLVSLLGAWVATRRHPYYMGYEA